MKKVRIIAAMKLFTIGFNWDNAFFSHCKTLNVEICVTLGKILMSITMKILKLERINFSILNVVLVFKPNTNEMNMQSN